jgi:hypothetical protein
MPHYPLLKGSALLMNQLIAMFMKKALYTWRTWYITLIQILMPAFFLTLTIIIVKTWQTIPDLPPLKIDMKVSFKFSYNPCVIKTWQKTSTQLCDILHLKDCRMLFFFSFEWQWRACVYMCAYAYKCAHMHAHTLLRITPRLKNVFVITLYILFK